MMSDKGVKLSTPSLAKMFVIGTNLKEDNL